jgi:tetratricopeptide (TPR) repeat protein
MLASCSDDFVDILPKGKDVIKTQDELNYLLNDMDNINWQGNAHVYALDNMYLVDDQARVNITDINTYIWADFPYAPSESDECWNNPYSSIVTASFVINKMSSLEKAEQTDPEHTLGRAYLIRAISYFNLINLYAKHYNESTASTDLGLPLVLEMEINSYKPRSSVQEIYDQIISDLEAAEPLFKEFPIEVTLDGHKSAVSALLGRVYLFQKKYDLAAQYSKQALDLHDYLDNYNNVAWRGTDPVLGLIGVDGWLSNQENTMACISKGAPATMYMSDGLLSVYDTINDLRYRHFTTEMESAFQRAPRRRIVNRSVFYSGINVSETILNYCEALMKKEQANPGEALTYLNKLRMNRYDAATYEDFDSDDNGEIYDEILLERRRELPYNITRWFDMRRFGVTATKTYKGKTYTITPESNNYVWPIPLDVMGFNDKLEQNPRGL